MQFLDKLTTYKPFYDHYGTGDIFGLPRDIVNDNVDINLLVMGQRIDTCLELVFKDYGGKLCKCDEPKQAFGITGISPTTWCQCGGEMYRENPRNIKTSILSK